MADELLKRYRSLLSCKSGQAVVFWTLLLLMTLSVTSAFAGVDMTVSGPKRFDRYKGAPNLYIDSFDRCEPSNLALLRITNGNGTDTSITSGEITVNGTVIFTEDDFKQQLFLMEKPISVLPHNELKVELKSSSKERSFVIVEVVGRNCDSTKPEIFAPTPADGALLKIARPHISASYRDEANGSGMDQATAKLTLDGSDVTSVATVTSSGITYQPSSDLAFGSHEAVLTVADRGANGAELVWHFTTDTVPPEFRISSPVSGAFLNTPFITVAGNINDPTAGVTLNGTNVPVAGNSFTLPGFPLSEGSNTIVARAMDPAGNVATETVTIILDTKDPVIAVASPADGIFLNTPKIGVSGSVDDVSTKVTVNGIAAAVSGTNFNLGDFQLAEGNNVITVEAEDSASNRTLVDVRVVLDTVNPVLQVDSPVSDSWVNTPVITVNGTVKEPNLEDLSINGVQTPVSLESFSRNNFSLTEGTNQIKLVALDKAGNEVPLLVTVNLDTVIPAVTILAPTKGLLTAKPQVTVSGTLSEDFTKVSVNGAPATVVGKEYSVAYTLAEGENKLVVRSVDRAGNVGTASVDVTLDSTPPAVPSLSPVVTPTNVGTVTLSGEAEALAAVQLFAGANSIGTVSADAQGRFTLAGVSLAQGNNSFTAVAIDKALNQSPVSEPLVVIFDTTAPQLAVSTLANGSYTNNATLNITGTATDNVALKELKVNGSLVSLNADGSYSHALLLKEGANQVTVLAVDQAGNESSDSRTVNLDQALPVITVAAPADNSKTKNPVLNFSGSVDAEARVELSLNGTVYPAMMDGLNFSAALNAAYGYNNVEISAVDLAGNKSSVKRTVIYDDKQPSLSVTSPGQDIRTNNSTLLIKGSTGDELTAVSVSVAMEGQTFTPAVTNGSFEQAVTFGTEKSYTVTVTATDEVGLATTVQRNIIYDVTPPALTIAAVTTPTNQATQTIGGTMEPGATVTVTCGSASVGPVSYPTSATWNATLSNLTAAANSIAVAARDETGNVSHANTSIIYDNTPPTGTIEVNAGAAITGNAAVQLRLGASDSSGVVSMRFSNDTTAWTDPVPFTATSPWTLTTGDGTKQVFARYQDLAGNWSEPIRAIIVLDTTAPVVSIATPIAGAFLNTREIEVSGSVNEPVSSVTVNGVAAKMSGQSWTLPVSLAEGINHFTVSVIDLAGNHGSASVDVNLDTQLPVVTVSEPQPGFLVNKDQLNIAGTLSEEFASVTVNGRVATVTGTGYSVVYHLEEGANVLELRAVDRAGNVGTASVTGTLDSIAPKAPVFSAAQTPTKIGTVTLTGSAEANSTVKIYAAGTLLATVTADAQERFTLADVALTEGSNSFTATATDKAANESASSEALAIILDTQAPKLAVSTLANGSYTNNATLNITGTATDNVALKELKVNGSVVSVNADGSYSHALPLKEGANAVTVVAVDQAGNESSDTRTVNLDQALPVITIAAPADNSKTKNPVLNFSGSVDAEAKVELSLNGTVYPAIMDGLNFSAALNAAYGFNTVEISAVDLAGNKSTVKRTVIYDDKEPSLSVTAPGQDIRTNSSSLVIKGTAGDELTAVSVTVAMDGQSFTPAVSNGSFEQGVSFGAEKSYTVTVTATDEVGLATTVQRNIIYDATPPALAIAAVTTPTNQATQVITGTMEAGATVTVTCGSASVGPVSYPASGTWSATVSNLSVDVNTVSVSAQDATGNVSQASTSITYDNTAPTGTISVNSGATVTGTAPVKLDLTSSDAGGVTDMRFSTDGATWSDPVAFSTSVPWSLMAGDGVKQIFVRYQDKAGNWSDPISASITLDTTAPVVTIAAPVANSFTNNRDAIVSGSVNEAVTSVTVNGGQAVITGQSWSLTVTLTEGANSFTVNAVDLAGNTGTGSVVVNLDTQVPAVTISTPATGLLTRVPQVTVSGSVSEESTTVTVNGMPATVTGSNWSLVYTLSELDNTLNVIATDRAGNAGSASVKVTLDSTAPAAPVLAAPVTPTNVATITLGGSAEPGATIKLFSGASLIGTVTADGQGSFTLPNVTLAEGPNSFTASATDKAGNESAASAAVTAVLDTQAPVITVTAPTEGGFFSVPQVSLAGSISEAVAVLTVNGQAVVPQGTSFEHGLTLVPGSNSITIVATDLAGNSATRTVAVTLDATPPVVTITAPASGLITRTAQVTVSGSINKPFTSATINGTAVTVTNQAYSVIYTLQEGDNALTVEATDRAGNKGSATVTVRLDTQAPVVSVSADAQATAGANITISLNASDNTKLTFVELRANGVPIWSGGDVTNVAEPVGYRLSPSLSAGSEVLLQARGVDSAGNEASASATVRITQGAAGPGYLQGKILDDTRGLRMAGAKVSVTDAAGTVHELTSDVEGGYFAEVPSGQAVVTVSRAGFTSVDRVITILPEKKALALDARLTKVSTTANLVDAAGALVRAEVGTGTAKKAVELEVPAGALAGSTDLRLTPISNQGLSGQLPSGWSPLGVVELQILEPVTAAPLGGGFAQPATVRFPLTAALVPSDVQLMLASYDAASRNWVAKGSAIVAADGLSATASVNGAGKYALIAADAAGVAIAAGSPLAAAPAQAIDFETVTTLGKVVPQAAPPATGLKAAGEVVLSAQDGTAPAFTSGLLLNSRITENFDLKSGDSLQTPSYTQDIILYRYPCLTNIGSGALSAVSPGSLRTTFPVAPSRDYTIVELLLGKVGLEIGVPASVETGVMVGPDGARLVDADGNILAIPQGALSQTVPVSTRNGVGAAAVGSGFTLLKVVDVNLTGQTLAKGAVLSIAAPANLDPSLPLLLARQIEVKGVAKLKLVALVKQGGSLLSSDTALAGVTLPGITTSGSYYFLQAAGPIGFVSGAVTDASGNPYPGALVKADLGPFVDLASTTGRYLLAAPVAPVTVTALDLYKNDEVSGSVILGSANQSVTLDLKILMLPPTLVSVTPSGVNVQPNSAVVATFSKSIDQGSVSAASFTLKDAAGSLVPGVFTFGVDGKVVTFSPAELLRSEQSYTVTLASSLKDLQGYGLGADTVRSFTVRKTTPPPMPPAGAVSGTFPDADGFVTVTATQGSAETGNTVLLINDATGEIVSVTPASNGSFTGKVRAQLGDEIKVVLMDHSGNQTLISYIAFKGTDGKYLVTAKGGKVEGEGGSLLEIPEGALSSPAVVSITLLAAADLPAMQAPGSYLGAVNVDTGGVGFKKAVEVSIPIPAGFDKNTPVFITRPSQIVTVDENGLEKTENVYEIIDSTKIVGDRISSACEPFPGVWAGGSLAFTGFVNITPVVVSGYTYQEMNGIAGYQPAPDGVVEVPVKDLATGNLIYQYDRPVPRAVIRASSAWNYISYTSSKGFYGTFAGMFELPPEMAAMANCMGYRMTATHPITMFSNTMDGFVCAAPYNVRDVNFKLAEKATMPPDHEPPVVNITATKATGTAGSYVDGIVVAGTELAIAVDVTDAAMGTANLTLEFVSAAEANTRQVPVPLSDPVMTNVGNQIRYKYVPSFDADFRGGAANLLKPLVPGLVRLVVDARDQAGNAITKALNLKVISQEEQPVTVDGAPSLMLITPAPGVTDVLTDAVISVGFSESVSGVSNGTFKLLDVTANLAVPAEVRVDVSNGQMKGILVPKINLSYGHVYRASLLSGITDTAPNPSYGGTLLPLPPKSWEFTTNKPAAGELSGGAFAGRDIDYYFANNTWYAYVAAGTDGWRVVDVTKIDKMQVVWPRPDLGVPSADFKFSPDFDYRHLDVDQGKSLLAMTDNVHLGVAESHYGYVRFYDLHNPKAPVLVGREKLAEAMSGVPLRVTLFNDYAYVCTTGVGLQVVDVEAAKAKQSRGLADGSTIVGYFDTNSPQYLGNPMFFEPYRSTAALLTTTSGKLLTLDLSFPTMPSLVNAFQPEDAASTASPKPLLRFGAVTAAADFSYKDAGGSLKMMDLAVAGLSSGGVRLVNLTDTSNPEIVGVVKNLDGSVATMFTKEITLNTGLGLAVAAALDAIYVIDVRDPYTPRVLNRIAQLPTSATNADGTAVMMDLGGEVALVQVGEKLYITGPGTSAVGGSAVKTVDLGTGRKISCSPNNPCDP